MGKNYIPEKDAERDPWVNNLLTYAKDNATRLSIPTLALLGPTTWYNAWHEDYEKCQSPSHTSADVTKKRDDWNMLDAGIRDLVNQHIRYNPAVTHADLTNMGLPIRDPTHTPKPKPEDHVDFTLSVDAQGHVVRADFHIAGSASRSKGSYHGVESRIWVLPLNEIPPAGPHHPGWRSEVDTATPWKRQFDDDEIGKRLYITMRWENPSVGRGEDPEASKGPWCAIQSVVIA
jgi:hypothetical protein